MIRVVEHTHDVLGFVDFGVLLARAVLAAIYGTLTCSFKWIPIKFLESNGRLRGLHHRQGDGHLV